MGPETSTASERELNSITDETRRRTKSARSPTDKAVVVCTDEGSQIQALDRTHPSLPMVKGPAVHLILDNHATHKNLRRGAFPASPTSSPRSRPTCA